LTCLPSFGYYESNTTVAGACLLPCLSCSLSATNCTSCDSGLLLVGGSCLACSDLFEGCELCSLTVCFSCNASYHKINDTFCNVLCDQSQCAECLNANSSYCVRCEKAVFNLIDGYCSGECGDGRLEGNDQCDDGNTEDRDGCNSSCLIEDNYNCTTKSSFLGYNYTAFCSFITPLGLSALTL
jgi:proprotein convertase subtilisin/kexin type 5